MVLRRQQEVRSRAGSSAGTAAGFFLYTSRTAYSRNVHVEMMWICTLRYSNNPPLRELADSGGSGLLARDERGTGRQGWMERVIYLKRCNGHSFSMPSGHFAESTSLTIVFS